jgi:hypothetical protein
VCTKNKVIFGDPRATGQYEKMVFTRIANRLKRNRFRAKYGNHVVIIYTMGKVGSSSVKAYLKKNYPYVPAFHIHFLSDNWLKKILPAMNAFFHSNIRDAEAVHKYLNEHPEQRVKIITIVREPLERDISDIFQNWKGRLQDRTINDVPYDELVSSFNAENHDYTLNWFDTEFKEYLGFDVYAQPFDFDKGYSIYKTGRADILCLQLEKMNGCIAEASEKFLGYTLRSDEAVNLSSEKTGKDLYKEMITRYRAPEDKLDLIYNSKFAVHFYSPEDRAAFRERWKHGKHS